MSWTIDYLRDDGVIRVKTNGEMTLELLVRMTADAIAAANKAGVNKFLIDHREMVPAVDTIQIYNLPAIMRDVGMNRQHQAAIVFPADSERGGDFRFYEDRIRNLGFNHRVFTDPEVAFEWLKSPGISE